MEEHVHVSNEEIATYISQRLDEMNYNITYEGVMAILDLEMEYYASIGLLV